MDQQQQCDYVTHVPDCFSASRLSYLEFPYCVLPNAQVVAIMLLLGWLGILFVNLALVVDSRIVPNLETISKALKMGDSLAGVTLLASALRPALLLQTTPRCVQTGGTATKLTQPREGARKRGRGRERESARAR